MPLKRLIRRLVALRKSQMVNEEAAEHEEHQDADDQDDAEVALLTQEKVSEVHAECWLHRLACSHVLEHDSLVINLLLLAQEHKYAGNAAVEAYPNVEENEAQKPLVILPANALIQPNTMVIKFFDASVTNRAVLGAGGLVNLAGWANILRLEHDLIVCVPALRYPRLRPVLDHAGVNCAGLVKAVIAHEHQHRSGVSVIAGQIRPGTVSEKHCLNIHVVPAASDHAVKYLHERIRLVYGPVEPVSEQVYDSVAEDGAGCFLRII